MVSEARRRLPPSLLPALRGLPVIVGIVLFHAGWTSAGTDNEIFRCDPAPLPLGEVCHIDPRRAEPEPAAPETLAQAPAARESCATTDAPPSGASPVSGDGELDAETRSMFRRYLEHELAKQEREDQRSPFVKDEHAPPSFSRLIDDPTRTNAAAFLRDQMELNLRHVKAQEAIRSVVMDLRSGRVDDQVVNGLSELQGEIQTRAVKARNPSEVLDEIRKDRMRETLEASVKGNPKPSVKPSPADGIGRLELRYYFSPSCSHCAEMTPDVETLERRYGSALTIVGIPIQLEGETITPQALRAYRNRYGITFPFEERHESIAQAVTEDGLEGVPLAVLVLPDLPGGPVHVPFTGARTTADIEAWLSQILEGLRASEPGHIDSDGCTASPSSAASAGNAS